MPYKGNEILLFTSNTGEVDRITFLKKDTMIAYPEAQSINGRTYEVVRIFCRHSNPWPPDGSESFWEIDFVALGKSKDKKARLDIHFLGTDATFYRLGGISVDSLDKLLPSSFLTKSGTYNDVYVLEPAGGMEYKQRSNYVTKVYWSKSHGLIRFDKQDSVYWELEKKYSP